MCLVCNLKTVTFDTVSGFTTAIVSPFRYQSWLTQSAYVLVPQTASYPSRLTPNFGFSTIKFLLTLIRASAPLLASRSACLQPTRNCADRNSRHRNHPCLHHHRLQCCLPWLSTTELTLSELGLLFLGESAYDGCRHRPSLASLHVGMVRRLPGHYTIPSWGGRRRPGTTGDAKHKLPWADRFPPCSDRTQPGGLGSTF